MTRFVSLALVLALLSACATPRPVLYPNDRLATTPKEQVKADVDDCDAKAKEYVKTHKAQLVAKKTGFGAFFGAFIGLIFGAFTGNYRTAIAEGAAVGAATGLVHGGVSAATKDAVQKRFVEVCLSEKGYQPIGWK